LFGDPNAVLKRSFNPHDLQPVVVDFDLKKISRLPAERRNKVIGENHPELLSYLANLQFHGKSSLAADYSISSYVRTIAD
jgi:hypothetical protein